MVDYAITAPLLFICEHGMGLYAARAGDAIGAAGFALALRRPVREV
ncbi:hypothetical protein [Methylocystis heyeri]|uniref:Uncharacterized protein n=1 Tax=Methylocystis heyeri TaxID=391905 RepID=A0A6B8KDW9_9HYPH|nr:hypothetical protein [Methylocystis heyeri]QGM45205.1 hypothetical protein H2LOC_005575 [Methylocystis heyeri]